MTDIADTMLVVHDQVPAADVPLVQLPSQPEGVPWPGDEWPIGASDAAIDGLVDAMFDHPELFGTTYAVVVIQGGRLRAERYGGELPSFTHPPTPVVAETPLLSWSMAKSILHAVVGMLVDEGRLDLAAPAPVRAWIDPDDPRRAITLEHLLAMRDGLAFREEYVDGEQSDVIAMLFGDGAADTAGFAARMPLAHEPGSHFNYSSGTSNLVAGIVGDVLGGDTPDQRRAAGERFLHERLFDPIGMTTARATFDDAGTFVASSYVHARASDFARFGLLYLRDGVWNDQRLLPEGWVDHARRVRSVDPDEGRLYGAHWWVAGDAAGGFWANGYEGQSILCVPAADLVAVRLGRTEKPLTPNLRRWHARLTAAAT
ncbi:MAG: serine hydrolase [Acidimicrobiia bacterium]|nr:serine hydrolase [Acidimicrobiia bacterium]